MMLCTACNFILKVLYTVLQQMSFYWFLHFLIETFFVWVIFIFIYQAYMCMYMHVCMCVYEHVLTIRYCMYVYMHVCISMCVCMYILNRWCMYIPNRLCTYIHTCVCRYILNRCWQFQFFFYSFLFHAQLLHQYIKLDIMKHKVMWIYFHI